MRIDVEILSISAEPRREHRSSWRHHRRPVLCLALISALFWGVVLGLTHLTIMIIRMGAIWSLEGACGFLSNGFVRGFLRGLLGGAVTATFLALIPPRPLNRLTFRRAAVLDGAAGAVVYLFATPASH